MLAVDLPFCRYPITPHPHKGMGTKAQRIY